MPEKEYIEDYVLEGKHNIEEHEFEERKLPERPQNLFQNYIEKNLFDVADSKTPTSIASAILKVTLQI